MSDIRTTLEQRSLRKLKNSINYAEKREAATAHHAEIAKAMLRGEPLQSSLSLEAQTLRTLYYGMLKDYKGEHYALPGPPNKRAQALWKRVADACMESGVDPKKYMRAQFAWFDKAFGKAPDLTQLSTSTAVERAREFTGSTERRIVGSHKAQVSLADVFRESEKLLRNMMRAQGCTSREEFYERFVLTEVFTFPQAFLKADPAYRKVANA